MHVKKRIAVDTSEDMHQRTKQAARQSEISMSDYARLALREKLDREEKHVES